MKFGYGRCHPDLVRSLREYLETLVQHGHDVRSGKFYRSGSSPSNIVHQKYVVLYQSRLTCHSLRSVGVPHDKTMNDVPFVTTLPPPSERT